MKVQDETTTVWSRGRASGNWVSTMIGARRRDSDRRWRSARRSRRGRWPPIQARPGRQRRQDRDHAPRKKRDRDRFRRGSGRHHAAARKAATIVVMMSRRPIERVAGRVVGADHERRVDGPCRCRRSREPAEHGREQGHIGREDRDPRPDPSFALCCHDRSGRCRFTHATLDLDHGRRSGSRGAQGREPGLDVRSRRGASRRPSGSSSETQPLKLNRPL